MAASVRVIVTGDRKVDRKLRALGKGAVPVARKAMRAAMKSVMLPSVRAEAPEDKGVLKRHVVVRAVKRKKRGTVALEVQVKADEQTRKRTSKGEDVFYPAVVEFGREGVPPDPFMLRAYTSDGPAARDQALHNMLDGTMREARS